MEEIMNDISYSNMKEMLSDCLYDVQTKAIDKVTFLGMSSGFQSLDELTDGFKKGKVFNCQIANLEYSRYYGGGYIQAYRTDIGEKRTFKISRIMSVNGHCFSRIFWNQIGDDFKQIY
jgi:hypothetical protein